MTDRDRDRDDKGRFAPSTDADADDLLNAMTPNEPYGTSELADHLNIPTRTARHYLNQLASEGRVNKKKPSETTAIWKLPDE